MLEVAGISADRIPGEAVIAARQYADAAPLHLGDHLDRGLELALHAELLADLWRQAPLAAFVQGRVGDADGRCDEDAVLLRLQHVDRLGIGEGGVVYDFDAVAETHLDRFGRARVRGDALAALARHFAHRLDLGVVHHRLLGPRPGYEFIARGIDLERIDALAH